MDVAMEFHVWTMRSLLCLPMIFHHVCARLGRRPANALPQGYHGAVSCLLKGSFSTYAYSRYFFFHLVFTMAEKEATIFILDLGASMAEIHSGRKESNLDWSMRYVWDKITDIVASNRKTLCVGVVGLRTDETNNKLQEDDGYENLAVLQELGPMSMSSLRSLQNSIKPSTTWAGDAISAIVLAVDMIDVFTKKLKWNRKIVLVTDGQGAIDGDDLGDIAKKMNDSNIQLTVL